ncbi:MAG: sensor histidine kinase [bacterium]
MVGELSKESVYSFKNGFEDVGILELKPEEKSYMKEVAQIMLQCRHDLMATWTDIFLKHIRAQKNTSAEDGFRDSENLAIQIHVVSLVNDFIEYLNERDLDGYIKSNVELGKKMAKEDLSFETVVFGFHFLGDACDFLLTQHFRDNTRLVDIMKALNKLHHNTLAIIAKEFFNEKNRKINLLQDSRNKIVLGLVDEVRDKLSFGKTLPDLYQSGIFEKNPEKLGYYMELLKETMDEALEVIADAMNYRKITNGSYDLKIESEDLVDIVRRIVEPFIPTLNTEHKSVFINGVRYEGGPVEKKVVASVDSKQISRVFGILFSNAAKYTKQEIRFLLEEREKDIYCAVRDNGFGIPEENQKRIFNSGIKTIQALGDQIGINSGIGIDSIKRIIELHQGTIGIDSKPGMGTTFYFSLPKEIAR